MPKNSIPRFQFFSGFKAGKTVKEETRIQDIQKMMSLKE